MSNLAAEMAARMAADGGAGLPPESQPAGGVPGNEGGQVPPEAPPAAAPTTPDSGAPDGPPDTIPYSRFKEVNDQLSELRGYGQLRELGYDPDSLGRLAAFEANYLQDPVGTWKVMADHLDLPQEIKDALEQHLADDAGAPPPGPAGAQPSATGPAYAELSPEDRARLERVDRMAAREAESERNAMLDGMLSHWDALDRADRIETPQQIKLMAISATANAGVQFPTNEALTEAARRTVVDYRSGQLGAVVQRTGRGGSPPALPGSPSAPSGPVSFGGDIKKATAAALAAIRDGRLPGFTPE